MSTLDQIPAKQNFRHLLLIGDTKLGKSTYAAQAALDGYLVIYIDSDNGANALLHHLRDSPEAKKRVIYLPTDNPYGFTNGLLTEGIFRWNMTKDKTFSSGMDSGTDKMIQVIPSKIPSSCILNLDSWSTTALDAMELGASKKSVRLEDLSGSEAMQGVYGDASMKLTLLCAVIQHCQFHAIVQAHGTIYEMYEKPLGQGPFKQKDMTLKEITKIPLSSSRPHGFNMGKYFNEIGWLQMNRFDKVELDFTRKFGRVGGGTPAKVGEVDSMSFAKLFGPVPELPVIDDSWFFSGTVEEWKTRFGKSSDKPAPKPAGVSAQGIVTNKPVNPTVAAMMKK